MKGLTHPCPGFCDVEGPGLEKRVGIKSHRPTVVVRTHSGTLAFGYTPHLVRRAFY